MGYESRRRVKPVNTHNYHWVPFIYVAALALLMSIGVFLG